MTLGGALWDLRDLSAFLKVPEPTCRKWIRLRKIPFTKCGRLLRFRPAAIESWLVDHSSEPREQRRR